LHPARSPVQGASIVLSAAQVRLNDKVHWKCNFQRMAKLGLATIERGRRQTTSFF
jgi:hypothetical protein